MRFFIMILAVLTIFHSVVLGSESVNIESPDVFVRVELVRSEIELIRAEMGMPRAKRGAFDVENAQPREAFFQAQTLFKKIDRLGFQIARHSVPPPDAPLGLIQPRHVYATVDAALTRIQMVKEHLGIPEVSAEIARDDTKTPSDVFQSIVQANRQLNLLLDKPFSARDSFQQVTLAFHHATRLRAHFPGKRIPDEEPFERKKRPTDVFHRLVRCYEHARTVASNSGIDMAELRPRGSQDDSVLPSDVYDMASLLVAELAHLHQLLTVETPSITSYPPGRVYPSHVYQRAGLLEFQLSELAKLVEKNPDWISTRTDSR